MSSCSTQRGRAASGAAVQYRGIRVGTVISAPYLIDDKGVQLFKSRQIPVLARIEVQRVSPTVMPMRRREQWRALFNKQFKGRAEG